MGETLGGVCGVQSGAFWWVRGNETKWVAAGFTMYVHGLLHHVQPGVRYGWRFGVRVRLEQAHWLECFASQRTMVTMWDPRYSRSRTSCDVSSSRFRGPCYPSSYFSSTSEPIDFRRIQHPLVTTTELAHHQLQIPQLLQTLTRISRNQRQCNPDHLSRSFQDPVHYATATLLW